MLFPTRPLVFFFHSLTSIERRKKLLWQGRHNLFRCAINMATGSLSLPLSLSWETREKEEELWEIFSCGEEIIIAFLGGGLFPIFFVVANVKDCFLMSTTFLIIRAFAYIFPALLIERRERQPPSLSLSLSLFSSFEEQLFERPAHLFFCKLRLLTFFSRKVSERQRKKALPFFSPSFSTPEKKRNFFFSCCLSSLDKHSTATGKEKMMKKSENFRIRNSNKK